MTDALDPRWIEDSEGKRVKLGSFPLLKSYSRCTWAALRVLIVSSNRVGQMLAGVLRLRATRGPEVVRGTEPVQSAVDWLVVVLWTGVDGLDLKVLSLCNVCLTAIVLALSQDEISEETHRVLSLNEALEHAAVLNGGWRCKIMWASLWVNRDWANNVEFIWVSLKDENPPPKVALIVWANLFPLLWKHGHLR